MSKCIILVTNFQKSSSAGYFPPQVPLNLQFGELKLRICQSMFFQTDYDKIKL